MKPGYKTVGFYVALVATAASALLASNVVADGGVVATAIGSFLTMVSATTYASFRDFEKFPQTGKPAWKKSEFWLSCAAALLTAVVASGVVSEQSTAGGYIAGAMSILTLLGYGKKSSLPPVA